MKTINRRRRLTSVTWKANMPPSVKSTKMPLARTTRKRLRRNDQGLGTL